MTFEANAAMADFGGAVSLRFSIGSHLPVFLATGFARACWFLRDSQVYVDGVMGVYDNVVFEANAAGSNGGAVSIPFEIGSHLPDVALGDTSGVGRFFPGIFEAHMLF